MSEDVERMEGATGTIETPESVRAPTPYDVYCAYSGSPFTVMAGVLGRSVKHNCPNAKFSNQEIRVAPPVHGICPNAYNNAAKIVAWSRFAQHALKPFVLLDADTVVLHDLEDIWQQEFDIAYCVRPHRCRIIGGVIFARPSAEVRFFFLHWACRALELLMNPELAGTLMLQYGGLSQTCISELTQALSAEMRFLELPASIWNSCDQTWAEFGPETRIIHMKGRLRRECMTGRVDVQGPNADLAPLVKEYIKYLMRRY